MARVKDIYAFLEEKAPFSVQLDFDNAGFLVGRREAPVQRVLVALDITPEVIAEAADMNAQLIVSHHPVIWGQISAVTDGDLTGRRLLALIENGIAAICAHTNLDAVEGGVNSALADRLSLLAPVPLVQDGVDEAGRPYGIGRVGLRAGGETTLAAFAEEVKERLQLQNVRLLDAGRPVHKIAVGGGACGGMIPEALAHGCDTFVTSDLKHDQYLEARALGINLIDAGHYSTETVICPVLADWLRAAFPDVDVRISERQGEVFQYL